MLLLEIAKGQNYHIAVPCLRIPWIKAQRVGLIFDTQDVSIPLQTAPQLKFTEWEIKIRERRSLDGNQGLTQAFWFNVILEHGVGKADEEG